MSEHTVIVNNVATPTGCYVDGHWGQYGPDHLADRATEFDWEPAEWHDDPRVIRKVERYFEVASITIDELPIGHLPDLAPFEETDE